ncbi:MAG: HAD family phosphatase [Bacteroidaceae bacterium]|nr:HAD family phosphatase [Bacteroidaceae bacterium]
MSFEKKIVIFDLGGVILDIHVERTFGALVALGIDSAVLSEDNSPFNAMMQRFDCGEISCEEFYDYIASLLPLWAHDIPAEELRERIHEVWNMMLGSYDRDKLHRIEELRNRGHRVVLLSNTNEGHWNEIERRLYFAIGAHLDDCFDALYLSYRMNMRKPGKEILLELLKSEGAHPDECIFFDDSKENCDAARSLGIEAVLVERNSLWTDFFMND